MTDVPCKRCGTCCLADMIGAADADDLERWRREDRNDILRHYHDVRWMGGHFVSATTGLAIRDCPFLDFRGGHFFCTIYETRPRVCRAFEPGSSEICPLFNKQG